MVAVAGTNRVEDGTAVAVFATAEFTVGFPWQAVEINARLKTRKARTRLTFPRWSPSGLYLLAARKGPGMYRVEPASRLRQYQR